MLDNRHDADPEPTGKTEATEPVNIKKSIRSELNFVLKLAREMGRADWRAMLAGMTSTEYADWRRFYCTHYFQDTQLNMHFFRADVRRTQPVFFANPDMHPADFSLFASGGRGRTGGDAGRK